MVVWKSYSEESRTETKQKCKAETIFTNDENWEAIFGLRDQEMSAVSVWHKRIGSAETQDGTECKKYKAEEWTLKYSPFFSLRGKLWVNHQTIIELSANHQSQWTGADTGFLPGEGAQWWTGAWKRLADVFWMVTLRPRGGRPPQRPPPGSAPGEYVQTCANHQPVMHWMWSDHTIMKPWSTHTEILKH